MDISQEDSLRLNVMLRQKLRAIRIDESAMCVHARGERGEVKVRLNPTCNDQKYLRWVKELISTFVLGTPGGYPVYLKRWTRMGQMRDESLQGLLLLGEPEAVVAVAHAPGLTVEIARDAWWIMPSAEVARKMLQNQQVAQSEFASELGAFLVEFLPFEEDPQAMVDTVRLILQANLVDAETRASLWRKGGRKSAIVVGFLAAIPDDLPDSQAHYPADEPPNRTEQSPIIDDSTADQEKLDLQSDWYSNQLRRCQGAAGQRFLSTLSSAVGKLNNPDVAIALFEAIPAYFRVPPCGNIDEIRDIKTLEQQVEVCLQQTHSHWQSLGKDQEAKIKAILTLALVSEYLLIPIFAQTDAVGSVMRKKIRHVTDYLILVIKTLLCNNKSLDHDVSALDKSSPS
ncbi:MAG: hypothetical protein ACC707_00755 [Thiohalomonadales bacterium]